MMAIKWRSLIAVAFTFWFFIQSNILIGSAIDTILVNGDNSVLNFNNRVKCFIDSAQDYDISNLGDEAFNKRFIKYCNGMPHGGGDIWAKFYVRTKGSKARAYILEVGGYKEIRVFYRKSNSSEYLSKVTGRHVAYPENELGNFHFRLNKVKVEMEPQTTYEFIIYYPNPGNELVALGFSLFSEDNWSYGIFKIDSKRNLLLGLFFGICFVLAIINFVYYFIHNDKTYLVYSIYIITLIYYMGSVYGMLDYTILIRFPKIYLPLENASLILSVICYLLFLKTFIATKIRYPFWNKIANYLIVALIVDMIISSWMFIISGMPQSAILIRNIVLLMILPFAAVFLIRIYPKANKVDHIFIAGSVVLVVTGIVSLAINIFSLYGDPDILFQVGIVIELVIFNIGLGVKSRNSEIEKLLAQEKLITQLEENERLQLSVNQDLERQVIKRTKEIQSQNDEMHHQKEELMSQRDTLEKQNRIVAQSMKELESIKSQLELIVEERTQQLQKANQELVQYNSQLEQYAFITAHNLRAPVARLKGLMYIFEKTSGVNQENNDVVKKIVSSAHEMDEVLSDINAILELKVKNDGKSHRVDIRGIIDKVRKILFENIHESNAEIVLKLDVHHIYANEPYLESIIYNLLSNAIKYRAEARKSKIDISTYKEDSKVILSISDNGIGIDLPKVGDKMFGLYQRFHNHAGGKGLGLYIVKTQVEALEGSIEIDSKVNEGTTFIITLPLTDAH